jgi:predicted dehydrogenase
MSKTALPVVIHGVTGRMGQIALKALQVIGKNEMVRLDGEVVDPVPIGLGRTKAKLEKIASEKGLEHIFTDLEEAMDFARKVNKKTQVYHNTLTTGIRKDALLQVLPQLDPKETGVYMEKPLAANYADGFEIVDALEKREFLHGVVHHMLATPGVRKALELIPRIKPLHAQMLFGYEVGSGLNGNKEYSGQRPDFNWTLEKGGGGIILDMCHEGYLSEAFFGKTAQLSSVARLQVPRRMSTDGETIITCNVEDFNALRRLHEKGVVNTSIWAWYRRVNSEFGPLEITIDGEEGSIVFGLYGLKVQWKETAPANRWERSVSGEQIKFREHWQYVEMSYEDPFALELADYLNCFLKGEKYAKDAIHALNILSEVEAQYESAAEEGKPVDASDIRYYPNPVSSDWQPERLQGKLRTVED